VGQYSIGADSLISFVWAVECRGGTLLDSKDLLKGDIVRSMAASVATTWTKLKPRVESCADLIKDRDLLENQGSFNAIIVYLTWYRLVFDRFDVVAGSVAVIERDSLEKQLNQLAAQFLDRWIFGSQWANVWGDGAVVNFQNFATELNTIFGKLKTEQAAGLIAVVDDSISQMMARVSTKAVEQINNVLVRDRRRVHAYHPFLWVWHRMEADRWKNSSIQMRTGRKRTSKLEVDHTVADAWWARSVEQQIQAKLATFVGSDEEKVLIAPDDFESRFDAFAFINLLGNCSLLDKSFNISKSDKPMRHFLEQVHEFTNGQVKMEDWEAALSLTPALTMPNKATFSAIKEAIKTRDALIRHDLIDFIGGRKYRVD